MGRATMEQLVTRRDAVLARYDDGGGGNRAAMLILANTTLSLTDERIWNHVTIAPVAWGPGTAVVEVDWPAIAAEWGWSPSERILVAAAAALSDGLGRKIDGPALDDLGYLDTRNLHVVIDALQLAQSYHNADMQRLQIVCRDAVAGAFNRLIFRLAEVPA